MWYIIRNGEILYSNLSEEEMIEIMEQDETGELECYDRDAMIAKRRI